MPLARPSTVGPGFLFALIPGVFAGCFSPTPVSLEALAPEVQHFAWVLLSEREEFVGGELVARSQEAPALRRDGELLLVFPVPSGSLRALGVSPELVPDRSPLRPADLCAPRFQPSEVYEWREGAFTPSSRSLPPLTGEALRVCASEPPMLSLVGISGLYCRATREPTEVCEWSLRFDQACALPASQREWLLRAWGAGGGCARPVADAECGLESDPGRLLSVTDCSGGVRAVVAAPSERLEAEVVSLPGISPPPYGTAPLSYYDGIPLPTRSGFVTGLVRLRSGDLVVAVSTVLSDARAWRLSGRTILHRVDPETLAVLGSSPPLDLLSFGLSEDSGSVETVLLAVAGQDRSRIRLLRVSLEGEVRAARDLPAPLIPQEDSDHLRYLGTWRARSAEALVSVLVGLRGDPSEDSARSLHISLLNPDTLEVVRTSTPSELGLARGVYGRHAFLTTEPDEERIALVSEVNDRLELFSLGGPGQPITSSGSLESTAGGSAQPLHATEVVGTDGLLQYVMSLSGRQRSWRNLRDWRSLTQYASGGPPSLTVPLAPGLLLAPELDVDTGDLRLYLLAPERMELMPAHAPVLGAVGPPGYEVHQAETVWLAFPWTGKLARVRRLTD